MRLGRLVNAAKQNAQPALRPWRTSCGNADHWQSKRQYKGYGKEDGGLAKTELETLSSRSGVIQLCLRPQTRYEASG